MYTFDKNVFEMNSENKPFLSPKSFQHTRQLTSGAVLLEKHQNIPFTSTETEDASLKLRKAEPENVNENHIGIGHDIRINELNKPFWHSPTPHSLASVNRTPENMDLSMDKSKSQVSLKTPKYGDAPVGPKLTSFEKPQREDNIMKTIKSNPHMEKIRADKNLFVETVKREIGRAHV